MTDAESLMKRARELGPALRERAARTDAPDESGTRARREGEEAQVAEDGAKASSR